MNRSFTLIELLVVIAIIALLMGILLPVLGLARLQSKVLVVNAELRGIGLALDAYSFDNNDKYPPTREDCMQLEHYHQLPKELVDEGYLPAPPSGTWMASGIEDRFNKGYTYKYWAVGEVVFDRNRIHSYLNAELWIPNGFPGNEKGQGKKYNDPSTSPVTWVLYSQGPRFDRVKMGALRYPVPRKTWYNPETQSGIITRMRLIKGWHIGSFEK